MLARRHARFGFESFVEGGTWFESWDCFYCLYGFCWRCVF